MASCGVNCLVDMQINFPGNSRFRPILGSDSRYINGLNSKHSSSHVHDHQSALRKLETMDVQNVFCMNGGNQCQTSYANGSRQVMMPKMRPILKENYVKDVEPRGGLFSLLGAQQLNLKPITNEEISSLRHPISCSTEIQTKERFAVVTGANKGIGLETVRQLASQGVTVVLTARNYKRGMEATSELHHSGFSNVVFHQLDVLDRTSILRLAKFIQESFGRLDILVNNAGATGVVVDEEGLRALNISPTSWLSGEATNLVQEVIKQTYENAEECLNTNYYGVKRVTEALLPLLQLSPGGARIVNVSSLRSELKRIPGEDIRKGLGDTETLTEEKVDAVLRRFLHDFKENALERRGWTLMLPAYSISKATLNAYTRILAKRYPYMRINCVHPGFVKTDFNWHTGVMTVEEGARGPVMLALLPDAGPTGCYFDRTQVAEF